MKNFRGRDRPRKRNSPRKEHRQTKNKTERDETAKTVPMRRRKNKSKKVPSAKPSPPVNKIPSTTSAQTAWLLPSKARSSHQTAAKAKIRITSTPSSPRSIVHNNIPAPARIGSPSRATKNVSAPSKNLERAWMKILPAQKNIPRIKKSKSASSKNIRVDGTSKPKHPLPSPPSSNPRAPSSLSTTRPQAEQDAALATSKKASKKPSRAPSSLSTRQDSDRASENAIKKPAKKNTIKSSGNKIKKPLSAPSWSSTKRSLPSSDRSKTRKEKSSSSQLAEKSKANMNWIMNLFDIAQTNKIEPAPAVEPAVEPAPHQEEIETHVAPVQKSPRRRHRRRRRRRRRKNDLKPPSNVDIPNKEKSQEEPPSKEHEHEQKRGRKKKESTKIKELQNQMAIQSAQITSLLGQVAEMMAQNKKQCQTTKGAERQRVGTALEIRGREQRVLNQIGSRKGVLNYVPRVGGKVPAKPK